jgi:transposase-like protein
VSRRPSTWTVPELAEDYATGATVDELAEKHGVERTTVYDALKAQGVPLRGHESWADVLTRDFLERRQGETISAIAREVGCSNSTVREWLGRHGMARLDPSTTKELRRLAKVGATHQEMAEALGCHPRTARRWIVRAGLVEVAAQGRARRKVKAITDRSR